MALDSCRADLQKAFLKLGIDSHVVKIHSVKDGLGLKFVHDPSFGFGGCRVESIRPGSAADATGGIRAGDFVLAVNDTYAAPHPQLSSPGLVSMTVPFLSSWSR